MRHDTITVTDAPCTAGPRRPIALTEGASVRARLEADARLAVYILGIFYIALWAITWLILGHGAALLRPEQGCRLEGLDVLFLWRCVGETHLPVVADLANGVLASTVWAPVVVLTAAVQPEVRLVAFLVVALHVVGLPAALLIAIRAGETLCDRIARRPAAGERAAPAPAPDDPGRTERTPRAASGAPLAPPRPKRPPVTPRKTFGLRRTIPT
ncbi:hypothetical protein [Rhodoplanes azumiensis]|uniref:Uncharacterized protein n=1 Tax=Rhodoplanes azumiensis TaxID=1897628 RepID=A0ABW5AE80_9BRAD